MTEPKTLEEALEKTISERLPIILGLHQCTAAPENPLFFPRKKLRMTKVYSGNWEPRAWFIKERLDEKATYLEQPTLISHEGLTSGFRSAIIKNPDNTYTKLKGVSLKPTIIEKTSPKNPLAKEITSAKGLCSLNEAHSELGFINIIQYLTEDFLWASPEFIETYRFYKQQPTIENFLKSFNRPPLIINYNCIRKKDFEQLEREFKRTMGEFKAHKGYGEEEYAVSAIRIKGDTRLDETMYHLTKRELSPGLAEKRDEIMKYLFFRAGIMNGILTSLGISWSSDLIQSNSHFGNFVLFSKKGVLDISLCDLGAAKHSSEYWSNEEFMDFSNQQIEDFQYEFEKTANLTIQRKYRHFPQQLKGDCFDAFRTGYGTIFLAEKQTTDIFLDNYNPPKIIVPKRAAITTEEFKDFLKEIKVV